MKVWFIFFLIAPLISLSQQRIIKVDVGHDTLVTSSGFKICIGQKLKIGTGSMPDGDFKFIRINSASIFNYSSDNGYNGLVNQANAFPRNASGMQYEVIKIDTRGNDRHGYIFYPVLKGTPRYEVDIDNAIASGEVIVPEEYRPKQKVMQVEIQGQNFSVADELLKLKKLKDDGVITDEEFQAQKQKLLDK